MAWNVLNVPTSYSHNLTLCPKPLVQELEKQLADLEAAEDAVGGPNFCSTGEPLVVIYGFGILKLVRKVFIIWFTT